MTKPLENIVVSRFSKPLASIYEKLQNDVSLNEEDGLALYESSDLLSIGALADFARKKRLQIQGLSHEEDYVYWINNHHLNLTNICEGKCRFCAYRKANGQEGSFLMALEDVESYVRQNVSTRASEIHIVSALNPQLNIEYCTQLLKTCKKLLPDTHIQAFTAVEIDYIAKISGITINEALTMLKNAGLGSLPGGGAEIFADRIRQMYCPEKISGEEWLSIMETAHNLGLKSNVTMLTGIGETAAEKLDHILKVRDLQTKTGGFMSFIPLVCHYQNTEVSQAHSQSGFDILKNYAVSRLMLDNIPHVKAFWIQVGQKLAQLSLAFGADDLDGTVIEEKISRSAGASSGQQLNSDGLINMVRAAGKIPVQRDTIYNVLSEIGTIK